MKAWTRRWTALLAAAMMLMSATGCKKEEAEDTTPQQTGLAVGYAQEGVTIVEDPDALTRAVDEMAEKAANSGISLEYKREAISNNGTDFVCYIANSLENTRNMFIAIYSDASYTDQLYLSQLLRPGQAFERLTLDRKLDPGEHEVYVAFCQVEEEDGQQVLYDQVFVVMEFSVEN